jgi:exodeoxyribonuclease V alpha subunit
MPNLPTLSTEDDTLSGAVERITFQSPDSGYTVLKIAPDGTYPKNAVDREGLISVVGVMPELIQGESVQFTGKWVDNPMYGRQFKAETVVPMAPQSEKGIIRYLSDTVYGIGNATAKRIYDHFGEDTMAILDANPERVSEVGIKPNLVNNVIAAFSEDRAQRQAMIHLQNFGMTANLAMKIYKQYGNEAVTIVRNDPYQLADEMQGIGFKKADTIARSIGIAPQSKERLRAGLAYALSQLANEWHTYAPRNKLLEATCELLEVEDVVGLSAILTAQALQGNLIIEPIWVNNEQIEAVYLPMYYRSEQGSSKRLKVMAESPSKITIRAKKIKWDSFLKDLTAQNDVSLSVQQQGAVKAAFTSKISVLTGGPGTGKTTTLKMVINALAEEDFSYALASPTGRAAKRLGEATEQSASTIHRLLEFNPQMGGFGRDEDYPLDVDILIIDESSMLDLILLYNVLKALRPTTHLMLVGDIDQLPSVGAGNVLRDVIDSGIAYVTRLDTIFRQDKKSYIVTNAHRINNGDLPYTDNQSDDFYFFNMPKAEDMADLVVDVVKNRIPTKFGFHPIDEVQVLAPMYRGVIGVEALNTALQKALNGEFGLAERKVAGRVFRKNDKVMQTKNNYEKEVFNGDIGKVYAIGEKGLTVMIDGNEIEYSDKDVEEQLIHAYCISTHRSQGSEYPVVVMPLATQHYMMLQRNLLYTAITRARKIVVLVGDKKAVAMAVNNNKVAERYSGLVTRLKKG